MVLVEISKPALISLRTSLEYLSKNELYAEPLAHLSLARTDSPRQCGVGVYGETEREFIARVWGSLMKTIKLAAEKR